MRWTTVAAALLTATPAAAQDVAVESAVYLETAHADGARQIAPASRLQRGDRVVTILRWHAPRGGSYTAVSRVPTGLAIESTSRAGLEASVDGGTAGTGSPIPTPCPRGQRTFAGRSTAAKGG